MTPRDLIGKPYQLGGRGPDAYDCWGVVLAFASVPDEWREVRGDVQAIVRAFQAGMTDRWRPVGLDQRRDGDVVALSRLSGEGRFHHAGVWWQGGVLHAHRPAVTWQREPALVADGWIQIEVFRWH